MIINSERYNLQLPCWRLYEMRQPPTSLCTTSNFLVYNLQLLHITSNFLMVAIVIMVATDMVDMLVMVDRTGQGGTGRDRTGRDGTGHN